MNPTLYKIAFIVYRNLYWVLLLGFLLMLFGYMSHVIYNQKVQLEYSKAIYHEQSNEIAGVKNLLSQHRNELGQQATKVVALKGDKQMLEMLLSDQNRAFAKQVQQLNLALKDLQSITSLKTTTSGQFVTLTRDSIIDRIVEKRQGDTSKQDTIQEKLTLINYKERNGWFTMTGSISKDTMKFVPTFYESFDIAIHEEKKPKKHLLDLFPGKHTVGTVLSKNPYIHTDHVKIIVQEKPKRRLWRIF